jgi:hypothetical protein
MVAMSLFMGGFVKASVLATEAVIYLLLAFVWMSSGTFTFR